MKNVTYISQLLAHKSLYLLIMAVFTVQACGPQLQTTQPSNGPQQVQNITDLNPEDINLDLCFANGGDVDDDGVCGGEELPGCEDDPTCVDDADVIRDGVNGDYNGGGTWGRWLSTIGIIAAGAGAAYGLVGASGLVSKKGEQKWGWLHQLIKDDPDKDGLGFLRLLDKNGYTLDDAVLDMEVINDEYFYNRNGMSWVAREKTIEIKSDVNFAVFINGKNHGGPVVSTNTEARVAGKVIKSCVAGKKNLVVQSGTLPLTMNDNTKQFKKVTMQILMKPEYTQVHKERMVYSGQNGFESLCKDSDHGGFFIALQLKDSDEYFVNALPTSTLAEAGYNTNVSAEGFDLGFALDYMIRATGDDNAADPIPNSIDADTTFEYYHYSTGIVDAASAPHIIELSASQVEDYNTLSSDEDRVLYLFGHTSVASHETKGEMIPEESEDAVNDGDSDPTTTSTTVTPESECEESLDQTNCEAKLSEIDDSFSRLIQSFVKDGNNVFLTFITNIYGDK